MGGAEPQEPGKEEYSRLGRDRGSCELEEGFPYSTWLPVVQHRQRPVCLVSQMLKQEDERTGFAMMCHRWLHILSASLFTFQSELAASGSCKDGASGSKNRSLEI